MVVTESGQVEKIVVAQDAEGEGQGSSQVMKATKSKCCIQTAQGPVTQELKRCTKESLQLYF